MWKLTVLSTIVIIITAQKATYDNYKIFRITPTTQKHITLLHELTQFHDRVRLLDINIINISTTEL